MLPRNFTSTILEKTVVAFCLCLKSLPEAKLKSFGLILSSEEISNSEVYTPLCCF